jgi:hypothetical protein
MQPLVLDLFQREQQSLRAVAGEHSLVGLDLAVIPALIRERDDGAARLILF